MTQPAGDKAPSSPGSPTRVTPAPRPAWDELPSRQRRTFRLRREDELAPAGTARDVAAPTRPGASRGHPDAAPAEPSASREEKRQVGAISRVVCQATMECLTGVRPLHQMRRWLDDPVYEKVAEFSDLTAHVRKARTASNGIETSFDRARPVQILRVRPSCLAPAIWEVSVVFAHGEQVRSFALRLEARRRAWRVMALDIG